MKPDLSSQPLVTCPEPAVLNEFLVGRLAPETMQSVADHLTACPPCAVALDDLDQKDSVVSKLRRYLTHPTPALDPECEQLAVVARAISLEPTGALTSSEDTQTLPNESRPEAPTPRQFGGYELLHRLGYGGMGVVWKARQVRLNRLVALKMIRFGMAASDMEHERFRLEGEAIARVRHANIVEVFHAGEHDGQPYFAMELLEAGTLAQKHRKHPYSPRAAAELLHTLALAVQAAHDAGVVHRDLKPSNVLFSVGGVAKIADFGLAKLVDADGSQTRTGDILGTPSYMAPEQARGDARGIGPRTDVYALGAILYELLTGAAPFRGADRDATLKQVLSGEPAPAPHFVEAKPRGLAAIALKCLEKDSRCRYPTAAALAEDLDRWLHDLRPKARFPGPLAHARGLIRRRAFLAASLGVCGLGAAGSLAGWMLRKPDPADDLERRLARGESVTLIGEKDAPAWSSWPLGKLESFVSRPADGAIQVQCQDAKLLELLRDPQSDHYRFRADVCHEQENKPASSSVGVYFGRHSHPSPNGPVHVFVEVTFNDIFDKVASANNFNLMHPKTPMLVPAANKLEMTAWDCGEETGTALVLDSNIAAGEVVQPTGGGNKRKWRSLVIEVEPDEIRVFWEGNNQPVLKAPTEKIEKNLQLSIAEAQRKNMPVSEVPVAFVPRGGLGLRVIKGIASFRNVSVEPLK